MLTWPRGEERVVECPGALWSALELFPCAGDRFVSTTGFFFIGVDERVAERPRPAWSARGLFLRAGDRFLSGTAFLRFGVDFLFGTDFDLEGVPRFLAAIVKSKNVKEA